MSVLTLSYQMKLIAKCDTGAWTDVDLARIRHTLKICFKEVAFETAWLLRPDATESAWMKRRTIMAIFPAVILKPKK